MRQEINLINPALRPRHDWVAFRSVALASAAALFLIATLYGYARYSAISAQQMQATVQARLASVQQEVQAAQAALAARVADPALAAESERLAAAVRQRSDVLHLAERLSEQGAGEVAEMMRGFARQRMEGVWLTAFSIGPGGFDIRGRLLDPSLLPGYIRRLNGEPAFRGRSFAALDMQGVGAEQAPAAGAQTPAITPVAVKPVGPARYTEFALRATLAGSGASAGGKE